MKTKIILSALAAAMTASLTGCGGTDNSSTNTYYYTEITDSYNTTNTGTDTNTTTEPTNEPTLVSSLITENTTLFKANSPYLLTGSPTVVKNGSILTIEPGVTIYGQAESYLVIAKGSKIIADGTAEAPITFTSAATMPTAAPALAPSLAPAAAGQWGGVVLLGKATVNASELFFEVDASNPDFAYGGTDDTDNSGILRNVKILNSGYPVGTDLEVNALSLCGVGNQTIVENITVIDSADDGIEIWGGSVNLNNISITGAMDDGFDVDSGYHGTVKNLTVTQTQPGSALIEMSNSGTTTPRTEWTLDGFSLQASVNQQAEGGIYFKDADVAIHALNGTINMTDSNASDSGLHNKAGVYSGSTLDNILVLGSATVDNNMTSGDAAGVTVLDTIVEDGAGNTFARPTILAKGASLIGDITEDTILTKANAPFLLDGLVKVKNGATLVIEAGVKIYGTSESYLVVTKGSKINANGTQADPIIFTSQAAFEGAPAAAGQWGGVTILGSAITNEPDTIRYEVDTSDEDFAYGGTNDTDNSGVLNYVQILNSGIALGGTDLEVNGLSLCGVGSGTIVDNITILDSGDDGIEIWGGSVNLNNISVTGAMDDGFDVDSGYHGTVKNLAVTQTQPGSALIEMTNHGDAIKQRTNWTLDGFTLTASANQVGEGGIYFKDSDVTATIKNGTVDMTASPVANKGAGLTNSTGTVYVSPVLENVKIKGSASVDVAVNKKDGTTADAGTATLNAALAADVTNTFTSY